jgi:competence protein ComEC
LAGLIIGVTAVSHPINLLFVGLIFWLRPVHGRVWAAAAFLIGLALSPPGPAPIKHRVVFNDAGGVSTRPRRTAHGFVFQATFHSGTYLIFTPDAPPPQGAEISVKGVATSEEATSAGVRGTILARPGGVQIVGPPPMLARLGENLRQSFATVAHEYLPPETADVVEATTFGADDLPADLKGRLRSAALISVASASGLQVFLIAGGLSFLLRRAPLRRGAQLLAIAFALGVYAFAVGLHPGVERAALTWLILNSAYLFRREADPISALCSASILELAINPAWVYDPGFQLSLALLGVGMHYLPQKRSVRGYMAAGLLAWFATTPILAYHFGEVNIVAPFVGAFVLPAIPYLCIVSGFGWIASVASPVLAGVIFQWLVGPIAGWILVVADSCARARFLSVTVPEFSAYWLPPIYAAFALGARISARAFRGVEK